MRANTMLLRFAGYDSGRKYVVAVRYVRADGPITCCADSEWWANPRGGEPVERCIGRKTLQGKAIPVNYPAIAA
jgi:hypothetical protein